MISTTELVTKGLKTWSPVKKNNLKIFEHKEQSKCLVL
jgi:hypothetical protein